MNQEELEFKYSRKFEQQHVKDFINYDDPKLIEMVDKVQAYKNKTYSYESKNLRVMQLDMMSEEIVLMILTCTASIQEIQPVAGICTVLGNKLGFSDVIEGVKTAAELLAVTDGRYFYMYPYNHPDNPTGTMGIKSTLILPIELRNLLDNMQYVPPMIEPPKDWTSNSNGGFHTIKQSVILGKLNHHGNYNGLPATNILQQNRYKLNEYICGMEETGKSLPKTTEELEQFNKFKRDSKQVTNDYIGREFYFVWKDDKRGRKYSQGYHINPQGSEYKKAQIDWADKEVLT